MRWYQHSTQGALPITSPRNSAPAVASSASSSAAAARALLAAQREGKYAELYDALMSLRGEPTDAAIRSEAERVGLDYARLRREMEDPAIQQRLDANIALARALRIEGTPALIIGETLVPGALPVAQIEQMVAAARQRRR